MLFQIHREKLFELFSPHLMDQQVSPCYHSFLIFTQSYHSKGTHIGALNAAKKAEAFLIYVFRIVFPATVFTS